MIRSLNRLGGHAETCKDPDTGTSLEVIVFGRVQEVRNYFKRFYLPLKVVPTSLGPPDYVDFTNGETVDYTPPDKAAVDAAFQGYAAKVAKYPGV